MRAPLAGLNKRPGGGEELPFELHLDCKLEHHPVDLYLDEMNERQSKELRATAHDLDIP